MSDLLKAAHLEIAKKHDTFHSEVITGLAGGVAGGAQIATATNAVTGQVQKTLPEVLNNIAPYYFGDFPNIGGQVVTLTNAMQCLVWQLADGGDGHSYAWSGAFPKVVAAGSTPTPLGSGGWVDRSDVTLRGELATAGGASIINNGESSVADQLNALLTKKSSTFNVDSYGAVGNASISVDKKTVTGTDDTVSFIAAIAAAKEAGGGKVECTPGKKYLITYTLLYHSNFVFDGNGATIIFKPNNGDSSLFLPETFQIADNTTYTTDIVIRNFTYAQPQDGDNIKGNLLGVMKARRVLLEDITVPWIYWHIFDGAGGKDCVVRRVNAYGGRTAAFQFDSSARNNTYAVYANDSAGIKMTCAYSSTTDFFTYAENCYVHDCVVENFTSADGAAFHWHGTGTRGIFVYNNKINNVYKPFYSDKNSYHNDVTITNNVCVNCVNGGVLLAIHKNLTISGNILHSAYKLQYALNMDDSITDADKCSLVISNNIIVGFGVGFFVRKYTVVTINGNSFRASGSGLPSSAADVLSSDIGCIVTVDCNQVSISGNTFGSCTVSGHIICKSSVDENKVGPYSISGNSSGSGGPGIVARGLWNSTITNNSFRVSRGGYYGIVDVAGSCIVISSNAVKVEDSSDGIYSTGTFTSVTGNILQSAVGSGYGVHFVGSNSPRSSMNTIINFKTESQVYLDTTTFSGKHLEPFATISKAATASGTNYTPAGVAI